MKGRKGQKPLEPRALDFIREHNLVSDEQQLLVGVSGGPDSVCLLHILAGLRKELGITLHVAHLNHQLRGTESEADAEYVSRLAGSLGIPATIGQRDVKAYQAKRRMSLEEAAREVRYTFLSEVARSIGTDRVAVGHTTDDHVETILMHLIRGTGTRGLRGLQPVSQWQSKGSSLVIIRPLLEISRKETAAYCDKYQLSPRLDVSNLSLSPLRNRVRHQLLPLLQSYNLQVTEALLRTARILNDDLDFLEKETSHLWGRVAQKQGGRVTLGKAQFLELSPALKRHLLRAAIQELLGSLKDVEARHIEAIMAALTKPAGRRLSLPDGLVFGIDYDCYWLTLDLANLSPFPVLGGEFSLKIPGDTLLAGWRVKATLMSTKEALHALAGEKEKRGMKAKDDLVAYMDFDKAGEKVVVRSARPGDRFQPSGMGQTKKLAEFLVNAKVPHLWRQRIPIVCSPEHILWVVGWRLDDRVKVTENTGRVLCLVFERR